MADDIMLEVTGSSNKAQTALNKVIIMITDMQDAFEKATPSLTAFSNKMETLASSSKAVAVFNNITQATDRQTLSAKNAESKLAMYQARLDRASVSSEKSRQQLEKLAAAHQKAAQAAAIDAHNEEFLSNIKYHGMTDTPSVVNKYSAPTETEPSVSSTPAGHSKLASEILGTSKTETVNVDTSKIETASAKVQAFIDRLTPAISGMSESAQSEFDALAGKLMNLSLQIDNQQALYRKLAVSASEAAEANGSESTKYLGLEKRMLSADSAIQRMIDKQEKLKSEMASMVSASNAAGLSLEEFGARAEKSAKKSSSGFSKAAQMMEKMFIRIAAFRIFSAIQQGITEGIQNMVRVDSKANQSMSQLSTSILYLKNSIAAALMPVLEALTPLIVNVIDALSYAFNQMAIFFAKLSGQTSVTIATKSFVDYAKSLDTSTKKAKELKRTVMGFDELNILQNPNSGSGSANTPDYSSMFKTIPITPFKNNLNDLSKHVKGFFDSLKDNSNKANKWFDNLSNKVKDFSTALQKVKLPELGSWKIPVFPPAHAPAIDLGDFEKSKEKYGLKIPAPGFQTASAPALGLTAFWESIKQYQTDVVAPAIKTAIAPAIDLASKFEPSITNAKQDLSDFSTSAQNSISTLGSNLSLNLGKTWENISSNTSQSLSGIGSNVNSWGSSLSASFVSTGTNLMENTRSTFSYIPKAAAGGLNAAGKGISDWMNSTSKNFVTWGNNIISNMGKTMSGWYKSFVDGLSSAWNQFTGFMNGIGEGISSWWSANKNWAAPVAVGLTAVGVTAAVVASGGAALPAVAALAPIGLATGGIVTSPTRALIGEGQDNEAVIPLNQHSFDGIAQGISESLSNSSSDLDTEKIIYAIQSLGKMILNRPVSLYADNREIARSANAGNRMIERRQHTIAQT